MLVRVAVLVLIFGLGTWLGGWWAVPLIGVLYAAGRRQSGVANEAALGAMLSWALLILINVGAPAFRVLMTRLSGVFPVPGVVVLVVAVLFAGLLAWSSARATYGIIEFRADRALA